MKQQLKEFKKEALKNKLGPEKVDEVFDKLQKITEMPNTTNDDKRERAQKLDAFKQNHQHVKGLWELLEDNWNKLNKETPPHHGIPEGIYYGGKRKSKKTKKVRKHRGIVQTGGSAGRLRKGYKYTGRRLKNGQAEIKKVNQTRK